MEFSACVHVKNIASIVGQIISMSASCGNVTQITTRYLHIVANSRSSWNRPFYSCVLSYLAMNASEAGGDHALIQTSLLFSCKCQLVSIRTA